MSYPTENLCRALDVPVEFRDDDPSTVTIAFARYDQWTEINDAYEGNFLERVGTGAFDEAFAGTAARAPRVLFEHGKDPQIGNKPLGSVVGFRSTKADALADVKLFTEADYVQSILPAMRAKELGASFRFSVEGESWSNPTRSASHNPNRLPERTLEKVKLFEFGPVTFPAYPGTGMRATTNEWVERLLHDPLFVARMTETYGARLVARMIPPLSADGNSDEPTVLLESADGDSSHAIARARIAAFLLQ